MDSLDEDLGGMDVDGDDGPGEGNGERREKAKYMKMFVSMSESSFAEQGNCSGANLHALESYRRRYPIDKRRISKLI